MIFLPRGIPVKQNVNHARINIPEVMEKLRGAKFTGYLRFDASHGNGIIIFAGGKLVSAFLMAGDKEPPLIAYDAIAKIFELAIAGDAKLNIYRCSKELAMWLHATLHGKYRVKQKELKRVDVAALLQKIKTESFNGCLRVFADKQTAMIVYDQGSPVGFFHDGKGDLQATADLSKSVARLPGARIDLLETVLVNDLVLADLMASADLAPLWQRMRKTLLHDRSQKEEAAVRNNEKNLEQRRREILSSLKSIAGVYIGKFGISQVEKAFATVSAEMKKEEVIAFFVAMERLATMVAKPKKVTLMIEEMRKQFKPL